MPAMHCPHCQGEIPPNSQFCGICGTSIELSSSPASKASLFAIPVSSGAKRIRIALILGLNTAMLGSGIWLLLGYLNKRDLAAAPLATQADSASSALRDSPKVGSPPASTELDTQAQDVRDSQAGRTNSAGPDRSSNSSGKSGDVQQRVDSVAIGGSKESVETSPTAGTDSKNVGQGTNTKRPPVVLDAGSPSRPDAKAREVTGQVDSSSGPKGVDGGAKNAETPSVLTPEEEVKRVRIVASKVSRIVASHSGQLGRCYKSAQKITTPDHPIEGVVKVQFAITSNGSAKSVRVSSNSTTSPSLAKCVAGLVRGWSFPQTPGPDLDFEWPFEFQAPK